MATTVERVAMVAAYLWSLEPAQSPSAVMLIPQAAVVVAAAAVFPVAAEGKPVQLRFLRQARS
jgi:hypothetical protein